MTLGSGLLARSERRVRRSCRIAVLKGLEIDLQLILVKGGSHKAVGRKELQAVDCPLGASCEMASAPAVHTGGAAANELSLIIYLSIYLSACLPA